MQAYEGYFENGSFYPIGITKRIPERKRTIITVLDEPVKDVPNGETVAAMLEAERIAHDPNVKGYSSFSELLQEVKDEMFLENT